MSQVELRPNLVPLQVQAAGSLLRSLVIGLTAFLTVVDLFATQAILPALVAAYRVSAVEMGVAVNASTFGMAAAGLLVALFSHRIERRAGIVLSLALLTVPTLLLASAPDLLTFTLLRIAQGLCMAAAFTLTLAYLAENCSAADTAGAFAAYITGNVASNFVGRLLAAGAVDHFGLAGNFYIFAALNLSGAVLVWFTLRRTRPMGDSAAAARPSPLAIWGEHLRNARLRTSFAVGFFILFAFIGAFTYVNFILVAEPIALSQMTLGFAYFAFLPSIATTPLAGRMVQRHGPRRALWSGLAIAGAGLPLLLLPSLAAVMAGLALVAAGLFFAQATATGFVGRAATADRAAASGLYLACYFIGGLVGSAVLGQVYVTFGWTACVAGIGAALLAGAVLARRLSLAEAPR
jgi:predicted MFS family arabinose efflux permease